jgi:hypothetical protein
VLATTQFTAGELELLASADKPLGTPKGIDIRITAAAKAGDGGAHTTECVAPLPRLKVAAGGAAPDSALPCPACKRCLRRLGLAKGERFTASVRARETGHLPASPWSAAVTGTL